MWTQAAVVAALLPALALCFSAEDDQLFRLKDRVVEDLGEGATFYSWLGLKKGASATEISRAFRKMSLKLHPDRNPGVAAADERFARLNQVHKILRSAMRDRYDYYLTVGFPLHNSEDDTWYYKRYRPSLLFVLVLVAAIFTGLHLAVLKTSAYRRRQHISGLINDARAEASKASKTGVITGITRVSHGNNVFAVHPTGDVHFDGLKLSPELVEEPTWRDTHAGRLYMKLRYGSDATQSETAASSLSDAAEDSKTDAEETGKASTSSASSEASQVIKKGAARRRPAAARGKAKIF